MTEKRKSYWIRHYIGECPVCGRWAGYDERVYGEAKPKEYEKRWVLMEYADAYDHCMI